MSGNVLRVADLFCGGGGASLGLVQAAQALGLKLELVAINHWRTAVTTHAENFPWARHLCASLDSLNPHTVASRLDVLIAAPECIHHADARGDRPVNDQSRASAWCIPRWAEALRPRWILVENIVQFLKWAPLGANGRPLKSRRGEVFHSWLNALRSLGYTLEYRRLNAANYGGATTRERLFILGRLDGVRSRGPLPWPAETHAPADQADGVGRDPWRPARTIIDWSLQGRSIFDRPKPLAPATLHRIATGARRFWGLDLAPFLVVLRNHADARSLDLPLPTITTSGNHVGLVEPFVLGQQSGSMPRQTSLPLPTIATGGAISLIEPFLISYYGTTNVSPIRRPLPTITTRDRFGLIEPKACDITLRMLASHELAAGQGFPPGYRFTGTDAEVKTQIGNAWEVTKATALCHSLLSAHVAREDRAA